MTENIKTSKISKIMLLVVGAILAFTLSGCGNGNTNASSNASNTSNSNLTTSIVQENAPADYVAHDWSAAIAPDGYQVQGKAIVNYSVNPGDYVYTGLDELGRTQVAYASITPADYQREKGEDREKFGSDADKISGWGHNVKTQIVFPDGRIYNGYFYNRSHLIADSLGGIPKRENLVTGSRFQNVGCGQGGGMGYTEQKARDWLASANDGEYLYYAVTPVYVGDELVPRSVYVDILSSDGDIDEHVEVFNVAGDPNYLIDYSTGAVLKDGEILK